MIGAGLAAAALVKRRSSPEEPAKRPRSKLQRETLEQLDLAIALLEGHGKEPAERTVHETRKALKRARALVRLQREALSRKRFRRLDGALRDAGRRLAGARDAEVAVEALERLLARHPKQLAHSAAIGELRARLRAERERAGAQAREGAPARRAVLKELRTTRRSVERWRLSVGEGKTARAGLRRIYREGRERQGRAQRRAAAGRNTAARRTATSEALHQWRKRVKDLRYAAEALELPSVARKADRLGEAIGEEHDLALLEERVQLHRGCFAGEKDARRTLRRLIRRRRRRLRRRAWRLGDELYRRKPKRFVRWAMKA